MLAILQIIFCVLPAPALKFAMRVFTYHEWYGSGSDFSNLSETTHQYGIMSIRLILTINVCSTIGFLLLIWYFNAAWPLQYGIVRPWYFPLSPLLRFFFGDEKEESALKQFEETKETDTRYFEEENTRNKVKVSIQNLHKVFGKKKALSGINLNLHENQLTALLGELVLFASAPDAFVNSGFFRVKATIRQVSLSIHFGAVRPRFAAN